MLTGSFLQEPTTKAACFLNLTPCEGVIKFPLRSFESTLCGFA